MRRGRARRASEPRATRDLIAARLQPSASAASRSEIFVVAEHQLDALPGGEGGERIPQVGAFADVALEVVAAAGARPLTTEPLAFGPASPEHREGGGSGSPGAGRRPKPCGPVGAGTARRTARRPLGRGPRPMLVAGEQVRDADTRRHVARVQLGHRAAVRFHHRVLPSRVGVSAAIEHLRRATPVGRYRSELPDLGGRGRVRYHRRVPPSNARFIDHGNRPQGHRSRGTRQGPARQAARGWQSARVLYGHGVELVAISLASQRPAPLLPRHARGGDGGRPRDRRQGAPRRSRARSSAITCADGTCTSTSSRFDETRRSRCRSRSMRSERPRASRPAA